MIDFTPALDAIGRIFVQGFSKRMKQQIGIDGEAYSRPEASTLAKRRYGTGMQKRQGKTLKNRTKRASSQSTKRLVVTGELSNEAFGYDVKNGACRVFAREVSHMGGLSYAQILRYNSRGQKDINKNIKRPPLVFPTNQSEISGMTTEIDLCNRVLRNALSKEIAKMKAAGLKKISTVLTIG